MHPTSTPDWGEDRLGWSPYAPLNTWSNAAYAFAGLWVLQHGIPTAGPVALALGLLAVGSGLYHATAQEWARRLDHAGIHAVFGALVVHGIAPLHPLTPWLMAPLAAVLTAWFVWLRPTDLTSVLGLYLIAAFTPAFLRGSVDHAVAAFLLLAVAYLAWQIDQRPTIPLGRLGHALWHVLTAVAIALLYRAQLP